MLDILQAFELGGTLLYEGKIMENLDDSTFAKQLIKHNSKVLITSQDSGSGSQKEWRRFKDTYLTDYFYMSRSYWDAVAFKPKRDVTFYGFGFFGNYNNSKQDLVLGWAIDDDEVQKVEATYEVDDLDPEKKWCRFLITDHGFKGVRVA